MPASQAFKKLESRLLGTLAPQTTAAISARMARIRRAGTKPELLVRRALSVAGIRYRKTNGELPGSPDLANRKRKWAVFVHGCYWHHHSGCSKATVPQSNRAFWLAKFAANTERDARAETNLREMGYLVLTVWECEIHRAKDFKRTISRILRSLRKRPQKRSRE